MFLSFLWTLLHSFKLAGSSEIFHPATNKTIWKCPCRFDVRRWMLNRAATAGCMKTQQWLTHTNKAGNKQSVPQAKCAALLWHFQANQLTEGLYWDALWWKMASNAQTHSGHNELMLQRKRSLCALRDTKHNKNNTKRGCNLYKHKAGPPAWQHAASNTQHVCCYQSSKSKTEIPKAGLRVTENSDITVRLKQKQTHLWPLMIENFGPSQRAVSHEKWNLKVTGNHLSLKHKFSIWTYWKLGSILTRWVYSHSTLVYWLYVVSILSNSELSFCFTAQRGKNYAAWWCLCSIITSFKGHIWTSAVFDHFWEKTFGNSLGLSWANNHKTNWSSEILWATLSPSSPSASNYLKW